MLYCGVHMRLQWMPTMSPTAILAIVGAFDAKIAIAERFLVARHNSDNQWTN
jgi:hypothetical protein